MRKIKTDRFKDLNERIAAEVSIVDYAQTNGLEPKRVGTFYTLKGMDSLRIFPNTNTFWRYSIGKGGNIFSFVQEVKGCSFKEAAEELTNYLPSVSANPVRTSPQIQPIKTSDTPPKPFELPEKYNGRYNALFGYLCNKRGIDGAVVADMVKRKIIYQDVDRNAVFVGYDYDDEAKYAFKKGTGYKPFGGDVAGSKKNPVGIYVNNGSNKLIVNEAFIDSMSVMSLIKMNGRNYKDYNYYSMQGANVKSIKYHLENNRHINHAELAFDNDESGLLFCKQAREDLADYGFSGTVIERLPDIDNGDYNKKLTDRIKNEEIKESEMSADD